MNQSEIDRIKAALGRVLLKDPGNMILKDLEASILTVEKFKLVLEEIAKQGECKCSASMTARQALGLAQDPNDLSTLGEAGFLDLYAEVVAKAKECLAEKNKNLPDPGQWPCGQTWDQLVGTSKSIFMHEARDLMKIDHNAFLKIARSWPWTDEGQTALDLLWGKQ